MRLNLEFDALFDEPDTAMHLEDGFCADYAQSNEIVLEALQQHDWKHRPPKPVQAVGTDLVTTEAKSCLQISQIFANPREEEEPDILSLPFR